MTAQQDLYDAVGVAANPRYEMLLDLRMDTWMLSVILLVLLFLIDKRMSKEMKESKEGKGTILVMKIIVATSMIISALFGLALTFS